MDELKRLVTEEDGDVYAVHGGRIVTARTVDQLGDGAVIQFVDRMLGGRQEEEEYDEEGGTKVTKVRRTKARRRRMRCLRCSTDAPGRE